MSKKAWVSGSSGHSLEGGERNLDKKQLEHEVEWQLESRPHMPSEQRVSLYNTLAMLKTSTEAPKGSAERPSISQRTKMDLHELQVLQKELNYQKRQVSKEIRKRIRQQQQEESLPVKP